MLSYFLCGLFIGTLVLLYEWWTEGHITVAGAVVFGLFTLLGFFSVFILVVMLLIVFLINYGDEVVM